MMFGIIIENSFNFIGACNFSSFFSLCYEVENIIFLYIYCGILENSKRVAFRNS